MSAPKQPLGGTDRLGAEDGHDAREPFSITGNGAALLDVIRRKVEVARSDLTHATALSQQTTHRLSEDLVARGLVQLRPPKIRGRGKPSPRLALDPNGAFGLGLAVASDSVTLTVCNLVGDVLHQQPLDVDANHPADVAARGRATLESVAQRLRLPVHRIAGTGVSMQGFRLQPGSAFITPIPLSAWSDVDVVQAIDPPFGLPVVVENNGTLGAIAELWAGAGRHYEDFAYLSINLGLGGGVVLRGAPYHGHHMNAAEVTAMFDDEEALRRPALVTLLQALGRDGIHVSSVADLRRRYDPTWPTLDRWVEDVRPALNQLLRALMAVLDPAAIVFGGEAPADLRRRLIAVSDPRAPDRFGRPVPGPRLMVSAIETDPSALGSALLPIRARLFSAEASAPVGS